MMKERQLSHTVEHLFRNEYGKVVALLVHRFGASHLETIEDVVQDTFIKAMRVWGYQNIPENPTAWLLKVGKNGMIDQLRKNRKNQNYSEAVLSESENIGAEPTTAAEITDSQLKMIFACSDPALSQEYQIILSLKLIGGFSNKELAEALLKKEEAVAKAFTRAKKRFKQEVQLLKVPVEMGLQSRLFIVLRVIYLLFSEGYATTSGSQILKKDICYEAMRLALLLRENKYCQHPNLEALIALMCFHASRFDARMDTNGNLVDLEHHDRSKYNPELIKIGIYHLKNAGTTNQQPSNYHLEAAVSYYHCTAKTFNETNWKAILECYDLQLRNQFSPMVALNRIIPLAKVNGARQALFELESLQQASNFDTTTLFFAIKAELQRELKEGDFEKTLEKAIQLCQNKLVKAHLERKLMQ
ncbi:MAG: sigma-70 family RNA polymerase sigma factor [Bacteroidota bacterium]